jgi:plasmid stabilization system protein ParE
MSRPVRWSTDALTDLADQVSYIATDNPSAARRVADAIDRTALDLGEMPTGRPGRVTGTYEKSVTGLPYILAYAITQTGGEEAVAIVRVIHTARNWRDERWPE